MYIMLFDILNFKKDKILMAYRCGMSKCVIVPNFAAIGQSMMDISRFFEFQDGSRPPSWIFQKLKFERSAGL